MTKKLSHFPNIELNKSVKNLTTFGVGGVVAGYIRVGTSAELVETIRQARVLKIPYLVMAGGSNLVFADGKINKLLIHIQTNPKSKSGIRLDRQALSAIASSDGGALTVEPGVPLQTLINFAIKHSLAGLEALSGIPGTVGGAVVGNAGAYGQTISDHLVSLEVFDGLPSRQASRKVRTLKKADAKFTYRDSIFKHNPPAGGWLILSVTFKLKVGDGKALKKKSREIIKTRLKKYSPSLKCPGSFFKNVLAKSVSKQSLAKVDKSKIIDGKIPAGYLLETAGAKGVRVGGLKVADYHGNLIINDGTATFTDVKKLAAKLKSLVKKRFTIELEEEVRYML